MIGSVRDRGTFEAFRRQGRRARRGPVTVVYLPQESSELGSVRMRVAFSVGRKYGNAVARNLLRRRLREIMRAMTRDGHSASPGAYLVIAHPNAARLSFAELRQTVEAACRGATS